MQTSGEVMNAFGFFVLLVCSSTKTTLSRSSSTKITGSRSALAPTSIMEGGKRQRVVWLFGDSILDNSYWHGVETETTGEVLRKMVSDNNSNDNQRDDDDGFEIKIKDRSTEELDSYRMLRHLKNREPVQVLEHYVDHRNEIGIPYDDAPTGAVTIAMVPPSSSNDNNNDDFVVLSIGGNDVVLRGETNPTIILDRIQQIVRWYHNEGGVPLQNMFYIIPYSPTEGTSRLLKARLGIDDPDVFYTTFVDRAKQMCASEKIHCISLEHFTDKERLEANTGIPEPTKAGATALAVLIHQAVLKQIQAEKKEEKKTAGSSEL